VETRQVRIVSQRRAWWALGLVVRRTELWVTIPAGDEVLRAGLVLLEHSVTEWTFEWFDSGARPARGMFVARQLRRPRATG
jgi:hypothetical protein